MEVNSASDYLTEAELFESNPASAELGRFAVFNLSLQDLNRTRTARSQACILYFIQMKMSG
ncbi:hypothetical protein [Coleofasciculus sp. FACHB-542]|uniref:hypothetical protein n=1 Tax=Coleofasciculus sp. FACHB-542 TaxID=2692787 RepID=UPI00168969F0|nr:hypothetical protein [Coleofasciculus sp. FACHB-542]MBD2085043.1 hypothetical protein [Coleofasciculus sp. FACHB-542]